LFADALFLDDELFVLDDEDVREKLDKAV